MRVEKGTVFHVLSTTGRDDLAGREMTQALVSLCIAEMKKQGVVLDPEKDFRELLLLNSSCDQAKHALSSQEKAYISWHAANRLFDLEVPRNQYESAIHPILDDIERLIHEALSMANLKPDGLDGVVMAGGASRTPALRKLVENIFSKEKVLSDLDPDQAIVRGAAMSVGHKFQEGIAAGDLALKAISEGFELVGDISLQDILGKALGVQALNTRTQAEVLAPIAEANVPVPFSGSKLFGLQNGGHGMVNVEIVLLQGNAGAPANTARVLEKFSLEGLPQGPLENRIEIFFDIDGNGLVKVRAVDTFSGLEISGEVVAAEAIQKIA
jgi:molecular chaperone DnaK (HSP70)